MAAPGRKRQSAAARIPALHGGAAALRGAGFGRRADDARRSGRDRARDQSAAPGLPYTILVSNWSLMTEERYLELRAAGVDQFSVSLDFPDDRHDDFRVHPGLYKHLSEIVPRLARLGHDDIVLNSCITSANVGEIAAIAGKAREWGVNLCYSAYSPKRTGCARLLAWRRPNRLRALNAGWTWWRRCATTPTGSSTPGARWTPRGATSRRAARRAARQACDFWWCGATACCSRAPCNSSNIPLEERARMVREFTAHNTCGECYVSIRSYLDKSFPQLLGENVAEFFSLQVREPARTFGGTGFSLCMTGRGLSHLALGRGECSFGCDWRVTGSPMRISVQL